MVSVIIPVYNVEKYLQQCIDSVRNQTYSDLEIIVVDDGSTDNSGCICDRYATTDERIIVIHKENGGLSEARNTGLSIARGEYVYYLDSDDYLRENAIEILVERASQERADFVFFDCETIYEDFEDSEYREEFFKKHTYDTDSGTRVLKAQQDQYEYCPCVPFMFFRRDFLNQNELRFENGMMHEDELFTVLAYIHAKIVAQVKHRLYIRRLRANSIMSDKVSLKSIDGVRICIEKLLKERVAYNEKSDERGVLEAAVRNLADSMLFKFQRLDRSDRKKAKWQMVTVKKLLAKEKWFGNKKLAIKFHFLKSYVMFKKYIKRN